MHTYPGTQYDWRTDVVDALIYASKSRSGNKVPHYLHPIFYYGLKKMKVTDPKQQCTTCMKVLSNKYHLERHMKDVHSLYGLRSPKEYFMQPERHV